MTEPEGGTDLRTQLASHWTKVCEEIAEALESASRPAGSVRIVGVTKYVDAATTQGIVDVGCTELGESRPQSLWDKHAKVVGTGLKWHLIGHLQRNKVRRTLPLVDLIHSVDSERLVAQLAADAASLEIRVRLLIEVNVTSDTSKTGASPDDAHRILEVASQSKHLQVCGVMGMASLEQNSVQARRDFEAIRLLRDQLAASGQIELPILSMGMSGDFREAIAEGSTMVRIGSSLFEGIAK